LLRAPDTEGGRPRTSAVAALALLGLVFATALAFYRFEIDRGPTVCLFRRVTGTPCPTCGLTRATALLLRGDWRAATAMHPALPMLALEGVVLTAAWWSDRRRGANRLVRWAVPLALANLTGLLLLWAFRWANGTLPV